ncbi:hypothetical protein [Streptomyces sp. NPDC004726]
MARIEAGAHSEEYAIDHVLMEGVSAEYDAWNGTGSAQEQGRKRGRTWGRI